MQAGKFRKWVCVCDVSCYNNKLCNKLVYANFMAGTLPTLHTFLLPPKVFYQLKQNRIYKSKELICFFCSYNPQIYILQTFLHASLVSIWYKTSCNHKSISQFIRRRNNLSSLIRMWYYKTMTLGPRMILKLPLCIERF